MTNPQIDEWYELALRQRRARRQADRRRRRRLPDVLHRGQDAPAPRACARRACARCGSASISKARRSWRSREPMLPVAILAGGLATRLRPAHRDAFPRRWSRSTASRSSPISCGCCARRASAASCSASATRRDDPASSSATARASAWRSSTRSTARRCSAPAARIRARAAAARRRVLRALRRFLPALRLRGASSGVSRHAASRR